MADELYAPPQADVSVADTSEKAFYVVAPRKFLLLSILTLGFYDVYWFYKNWRIVKLRDNLDIWPPMRGLFYIFFTHSLFERVDTELRAGDNYEDWHSSSVATVVVLLAISSAILDRMTRYSVGEPFTDILSVLLIPVGAWVLLRAQKAINLACEDPQGSSNSSLTVGNWIWMILGGLMWLLVAFGLYLLIANPAWLAE